MAGDRVSRATRLTQGGTALATFRQNVEATIPALRRYARALTRDADIADDLVQDTLVRALRSEHLFHGGDVRSWLYTILTNLNRNRLRSLARRPSMSSLEDNDARTPAVRKPAGATSNARWRRWWRTSARSAAGGAGRPDLPRSRGHPGRADRHRDVAARARTRADQSLSRRRAPGAAAGEMKDEKVNHDRSRFTRDRGRTARLCRRRIAGRPPGRCRRLARQRIPIRPRGSPPGARRPMRIRARYGAVADEPVPQRLEARPGAAPRPRQRPRLCGNGGRRRADRASSIGGAAGWLAHGASAAAPSGFDNFTADALDAYRLYVVEVRHPVEVPGNERPHLTQWLSKRLGTELRIPDLQSIGLKLVGGRLAAGTDRSGRVLHV